MESKVQSSQDKNSDQNDTKDRSKHFLTSVLAKLKKQQDLLNDLNPVLPISDDNALWISYVM